MTAEKVYTVTAEELEQLRDDGDCVKLESGAELRLHFEPDQEGIRDISDYGEVYGRTEWTRNSDYGPIRPADFTGDAEILARDYPHTLWWEPYDVKGIPGGRQGEGFRKYRALVRDILEYGFYVAGLELWEPVTDSRGHEHWVQLDSAYLGGIEPNPEEYLREVTRDLLAELECAELEQNGAEQ